MLSLRIHETGGPDMLRADDVSLPQPGPGDLRFRVEAAGVNFIDVYQRSGLYPVKLPATLGLEAAGVVTAVGEGVKEFKVGDRIASAKVNGAYAEEALVAAGGAVGIPQGVPTQTAAAVMLQGMTAHYLACDTYPLKSGDTALVHAGAGGVGLLLIQIAKMRGARVIATVGTEEKAALARGAGADQVCIYTRDNFVEAVRSFTSNEGVHVAYDSVGKDTFEGTLNSLRPRGMFVSYGNSSGPVAAFAPLVLSQKGSLFFTRPTMGHYTLTTEEMRKRAGDLFAWIAGARLQVRVGATFPLRDVAEAHRALEGRATTGKVLLLPTGR